MRRRSKNASRARRIALLFAALCGLLGGVALQGRQAASFYLRDGDRVVFYGDSITEQRLYTADIESYVVTRFPSLNVSFTNSGWSGDRATMSGGGPIDVRLRRDVFAYQPTVVSVMLGMNDAGYRAYDPGVFDAFSSAYEFMVDAVRKALPHVRMTLVQPSPFDDVTRPPQFAGGYNAVLIRYGAFVKQLGERENLAVADMNAPVVETLQRAEKADPRMAQEIIPDRVHPSPAGHLVMAAALLRAWDAPSLVASVQIDAAAHRVVRAENAQVTLFDASKGLAWSETDRALPMPLDLDDPVVRLVLRCSDVAATLDQEPLRVTGLQAPEYALTIDGAKVGVYSAQKLAEGVNLALEPTPMEEQAKAANDLTRKHNEVHFARWRLVQVPLEKDRAPEVQAALDGLDRLEAELVKEQRAAAQPKTHRYELTPQ
ncbi:MAG TPA: SGNH/GDSL hydrolase family protein [Terriglobia bacterium]|nr:SGNH/GDSL hydrolase family protein [Terriglobia bacterium]